MKFILLLLAYLLLFWLLIFFWNTSEGDVNASIISGVFALLGTGLGTGLGWALSEFSKRGRVKVYDITSEFDAKKMATGISELLASQGANGSRGIGEFDEQGRPISEGKVCTAVLGDMEKLEIRLSIDFHNTSSEMNYVRLSKVSLNCIGFKWWSSDAVPMFTDQFVHTSKVKHLNIPGLDMKTCYTSVSIELSQKLKESRFVSKFGKLVLYYEDRDRMRKYEFKKFQVALSDSLNSSKSQLEGLKGIYPNRSQENHCSGNPPA